MEQLPTKIHGEAEKRPGVTELVGFLAGMRSVVEDNAHKQHWSDFDFTDALAVLREEDREASEMIDRIIDAMDRFPEGSDARIAAVGACLPNLRKECLDMAIGYFFLWRWTYSENGRNGV